MDDEFDRRRLLKGGAVAGAAGIASVPFLGSAAAATDVNPYAWFHNAADDVSVENETWTALKAWSPVLNTTGMTANATTGEVTVSATDSGLWALLVHVAWPVIDRPAHRRIIRTVNGSGDTEAASEVVSAPYSVVSGTYTSAPPNFAQRHQLVNQAGWILSGSETAKFTVEVWQNSGVPVTLDGIFAEAQSLCLCKVSNW